MKYIVKVNGKTYEVEVEASDSVKEQQATANATAPKTEEKPKPQTNAPAGGTKIDAPMPGTIKKVCVKNGDRVKKNDVLFILEAMKLENEIMAPCDGTVSGVSVSESSTVNPGDSLCVIA